MTNTDKIIVVFITIASITFGYCLGDSNNKDVQKVEVKTTERCAPCSDSTYIAEYKGLAGYYRNDSLVLRIVCGWDSFIYFKLNDTVNYTVYYSGTIDSVLYNNPKETKQSYYPWYK